MSELRQEDFRSEYVPEAISDPSLLQSGDTWWRRCPDCGAPTQGGVDGFSAHWYRLHDLDGANPPLWSTGLQEDPDTVLVQPGTPRPTLVPALRIPRPRRRHVIAQQGALFDLPEDPA